MRDPASILRTLTILALALFGLAPRPSAARAALPRSLVKQITSGRHPDSTAVLVLFDSELVTALRSALPSSIAVLRFGPPAVEGDGTMARTQLGALYREASSATEAFTDVWIVGWSKDSAPVRPAARFAESAVRMLRTRKLRDRIPTPHGTLEFSRWIDQPRGVAQRVEMRRAQAWADSVIAAGPPKRTLIRVPFTASDLAIDADTLSLYVGRLADTSFYSIGGCSDVELVFWRAPERLSQLGPGVVPVLYQHIADPDPIVRERVLEALLSATQDERILARTDGSYLKFYEQPDRPPRDIAMEWWAKFGHFWTPADSTR